MLSISHHSCLVKRKQQSVKKNKFLSWKFFNISIFDFFYKKHFDTRINTIIYPVTNNRSNRMQFQLWMVMWVIVFLLSVILAAILLFLAYIFLLSYAIPALWKRTTSFNKIVMSEIILKLIWLFSLSRRPFWRPYCFLENDFS